MKKWLFVILSIILTLGYVGCSSTNTQKNNNTSNSIHLPSDNPTDSSILQKTPVIKIQKDEIKPFLPTQLIIPAIHVYAEIVPVDLLENGQMAVPKETELVGILQPGILAGEKGNMILDGHVDSYIGPAIFFDLKKLKYGDQVIVRNNKSNRQLTYTVESVEVYTTSESPEERIFGKTNESRLNLITCTGKYSRKKQEHEQRLVVFTKLVDEP